MQAKLEAEQAEAARLKPLAEQAAALKAKADEAEQKRMEEQGQFKELAERRAGELNKTQQRLIRAEVRAAAIQEGIIDRDLVQLIPIGRTPLRLMKLSMPSKSPSSSTPSPQMIGRSTRVLSVTEPSVSPDA